MINITPFLNNLISSPGISGNEKPVRRLIEETWKPYVDELRTSKVGSLHGCVRGNGAEPRRRLLFAAHMDAIGLMVNRIVNGYLGFIAIGGIDPRVLPGQQVTVHGKCDIYGIIVQPASRHLPEDEKSAPVDISHLWIDTGLLEEDVRTNIQVGDPISFAQKPLNMGEDTLAGHSLDNRASIAALTVCLDLIHQRSTTWDIWTAATVQEETRLLGAVTSAFDLQPDLAVAVDVTFAKSDGSDDYRTFPLGEGITLGWGADIHPALYRRFKKLADDYEIPYKTEVMPVYSGTDSMAMQISRAGIPNMVISIPIRYMHSPVEVVSLKDIYRAGRLLAEFAVSLDDSTLEQITWENE